MDDIYLGDEIYLSDGVYARYNGYEIWLRAPRENGDHVICLDVDMLETLRKIVVKYHLES